jgi:hypothetical protein
MMRRLRCTWHELQSMPQDVLLVFDAFIRGEDEAAKAKEV